MHNKNKCAICNNSPANFISPKSYHKVCENHAQYSTVFIKEFVQKKLGLINQYPSSLKKCIICNISLNDEDMDRINEHTLNITCNDHKDVSNWQQLDVAKNWFKYKTLYPNATIQQNEKSFFKWLTKNKI